MRPQTNRGQRAQLAELSVLVSDLIELARNGDSVTREREEIRLDLLVADTVARASTHAPAVRFQTKLEPCLIEGDEPRLARAVTNLLDNAIKWSPPGAAIEVTVQAGEVSVRDHGPGIADTELPLVFERFYRGPAARGLPGSGLGLAIVKQVAEEHGGVVRAERPAGGGTRLRLKL